VSTASLLRKAAEALDDGRDPLHESFLSDNQVTLDEAYTLAEMLALGARIVATGLEKPSSAPGMVLMAQMASSA
jgi:hypothetical protein